MLKDMNSYHLKQLLDAGLDSLKTASKKVVHKACEFLRNKIAYAVTKSNDDKIVGTDENPRNIEEITILPEKGDVILNKLREVFKNGTL